MATFSLPWKYYYNWTGSKYTGTVTGNSPTIPDPSIIKKQQCKKGWKQYDIPLRLCVDGYQPKQTPRIRSGMR